MSAEQATDKADKLIGQILANRYQIELKLGEGAMGAVYRAKHVKVGRPFAVKILHKKLLEDTKVAQRFEREAELAGRLRHPNVVGVVDVGETTDGLRYMVMDFAEGEDLATLLNEAPMPSERIMHLTRQMLEGLYHAHEAGLIHRDFKPENVIIERNDHGSELPRIVDFGIAILREGGQSATSTGRLTTNGLVLGTPHYMAPEQAVADPIDHRIDLFALGIVVYEMLSGKLPFDGTGAEVARANLLLDPPLISQRVPYLEVDPLLEAFARRLMAKKRDGRPATAKVAREILDLIERDRPAAAAALGVPIAGARAPQVTQDVVPQRAVNEDSGNYMVPSEAPSQPTPPPLTMHVPSNMPRATHLEAPPVGQRRGEANILTSPAPPLSWGEPRSNDNDDDIDAAPRSSRRGWIIAGVAAAVATAAILLIVSRGGDTKPAETEKVVMQATEPVPTPTPPVPTTDETPGTTNGTNDTNGTTNDTTPDTTAGTTPDTTNGTAPDESTNVADDLIELGIEPATGDPTSTNKKDRRRGRRGTKPDTKIAGQPEIKPTEVTKPVEVIKPVETPPEVVKPDPPKAPDGFDVTYAAVGRDLKRLGDKASDLWPKYRMIRYNEALTSPEKMAQAKQILAELQKTIPTRK